MDVQIDKFGRIVIPKPVRDALGLEAGTTLQLETTERETGEQEIALRPDREKPALRRKDGVLVHTGKLQEKAFDFNAFMRAQREERARRIAGLGASSESSS